MRAIAVIGIALLLNPILDLGKHRMAEAATSELVKVVALLGAAVMVPCSAGLAGLGAGLLRRWPGDRTVRVGLVPTRRRSCIPPSSAW